MKTLDSEYNMVLYYVTTIAGWSVHVHGLGWRDPPFPKCLMMLGAWPMAEQHQPRPKEPWTSKGLHQFQKNNLLPYLEGSSLPSMSGLGSGRGLEW